MTHNGRVTPSPSSDTSRGDLALPTLAQSIFSTNVQVLVDACWDLSYLSDGPNEAKQEIMDAGLSDVCRRLIELLLNPSPAVQLPALRTVGNLVAGSDMQTQRFVDNHALPYLLELLSSPAKGLRQMACWAISNITAGSEKQIQAVIVNGIIPPLVHLLRHDAFGVRKEAAWAIRNALVGGSVQQIQYLVQHGCIRPLCDLLTVSDRTLVTLALQGLERTLRMGGDWARQTGGPNPVAGYIYEAEGLSKVEDLQRHADHQIYYRCMTMIEKYFGVEEEEGKDAIAMNGFAYGGYGFDMDMTG